MEKQQFSGKTLEEALAVASKALGAEVHSLSYNILPATGGGFLSKLFSRGAVRVEAWIENKKADLEAAAREAVREAFRSQAGKIGADTPTSDAGTGAERAMTKGAAPSSEHKQTKKVDRDASNAQHRDPQQRTATGTGRGGESRGENRSSDHSKQGRDGKRRGEVGTHGQQRNPAASKSAHAPHVNGPRNLDRPQRKIHAPQISAGAAGTDSESGLGSGPAESSPANKAPTLTFDSPGVEDILKDYALNFLKAFDVAPDNVTFCRSDLGDMTVSVQSEFLEGLLARSDKLSGAFEHVFKRIAQRKLGDVGGRLYLNSGAAQDERAERLKGMALSLAEKVKKTGKTITLSSKSSQERRVIHLALDGYEGVGTRSVGSGENRKLIIFSTERPARKKQPGCGNGKPKQTNKVTDAVGDAAARLAAEGARALVKPSSGSNGGNRRRNPMRKGQNPRNAAHRDGQMGASAAAAAAGTETPASAVAPDKGAAGASSGSRRAESVATSASEHTHDAPKE